MREERATASVVLMAVKSATPHMSVRRAFMMQIDKPPLGTGVGGPKKQLASRAQLLGIAPQSASAVHDAPGFVFRQCMAGPAPLVQSAGPVPSLPPRVRVEPEVPVIARSKVNPSGRATPGMLADPE